jgi:TRAP-type C4-dicarboxylate transport system permease small subunit
VSEKDDDEPKTPSKGADAEVVGPSAVPEAQHTNERPSQLQLDIDKAIDPHPTFPDDGAVSRYVRVVDNSLGSIEQAFLFALLAAVVLTAAGAALSEKVFGHHLGRWWFTVVRGGTFTVAMMGAVYATHQQRHLAMDLISRRLSPRGRLILGVLLKVFTMFIAALLFRSGMHQREHVGGGVEELISDKTIVTMMPIGAALIILHSFLHVVIDIDYLVRGKLPPEKARTGH